MSGTASDPFFWNDWQGDPLLRLCSMAAQGFWMRCLCLAAESPKKGFVLVAGRKPTAEDFAAICGTPPSDCEKWIRELVSNGVCSLTRNGIIYCRRMVKEAKKKAASKKGGKIGGAVTRDKQKGIFSTQEGTQEGTQGATQHPRRAPFPFPSPSPIPLEEEEEEKSILAKVAKPRASRADTLNGHKSDFETFWAIYPKKVAKGAAARAYAKALSKADPGTILAGAKRYAAARSKEPPEYTKHPGTWLNAECWLDGEGDKPKADPEWERLWELERENLKRLGFTGGKND